ncbi:MAG: Rap1a/Tai family immunity protein [Bacteroidota bacterium]
MRHALLLAGFLVAGMTPASAATIENFQVRTAADLVDLCDTDPSSVHYIAAIHFCQGFGIGAYQYYAAQVTEDPSTRFVCIPNPPPTRNEAMAAFVGLARAHPEYMNDAPVDTLFRYLGQTYPCSR